MKKQLTLLAVAFATLTFFTACKKSSDDSSSGGSPNPTATCSDGIQNQGETGIDCGGPCAACPANSTVTATVSNGVVGGWAYSFNSTNATATRTNLAGSITYTFNGNHANASSNTSKITMTLYGTPLINTSYDNNNAPPTFNISYRDSASNVYVHNTGSIYFTKLDQTAKLMSGTFSVTTSNVSTGNVRKITSGTFSNLQWN